MRKINKLAVFFGVIFLVFFILSANKIIRSFSSEKDEYRYLSLFSEVVSLVKTDYVEEVNPVEKFPGAFSAMLSSLDRCSAYLDKTNTQLYHLFCQGRANTGGIYVVKSSNYFLVTSILGQYDQNPNDLHPGDYIKAINGKSIYGKSYWEMFLALTTAEPGTVDIVVFKNGDRDPTQIQLKTHPLAESPVFKTIADPKSIEKPSAPIYYIDLSRLDSHRIGQLKNELTKLDTTLPLKLIIDLRFYNGGDFSAFKEAAKIFFPQPMPLTLETKQGKEIFELGSDSPLSYQAVILIDPSTILFNELLAYLFNELPDNEQHHTTLLGKNTPGFIPELKQIPLSDGSSILLTSGFFLFQDKNISSIGIKPDVRLTKKELPTIIKRSVALLSTLEK